MEAPVLQLEHLSKSYGNLHALEDVSLSIPRGEIFALLGPNGAGKTTLIGSVCGLVRKSAGKVRLFGVDMDEDPIRPRYDVGLVPQEVNFDPFFSPAESLRIQLGYYGRPPDEARVREVLEAMQLASKADVPTRALSGGMRRRLLIAKALVHRPKLVFLDEPTAGVDVELRQQLWAYVRRLREEGTTIVLTTHYLEEAEELADRVGIIDRGRLLLVEGKAQLLAQLGERRLTVRLSTPVAALPPDVQALGARLEEGGRRVVYAERHGCPPAHRVLASLYTAGLPVEDVDLVRPRLEDVLLQVLRGPGRA